LNLPSELEIRRNGFLLIPRAVSRLIRETDGAVAFALWSILCERAAHDDRAVGNVSLHRGQLVTSHSRLSLELEPARSTRAQARMKSVIRRALDRWEARGWITVARTTQQPTQRTAQQPTQRIAQQEAHRSTQPGTIITILLYELYGSDFWKPTQQPTQQPTQAEAQTEFSGSSEGDSKEGTSSEANPPPTRGKREIPEDFLPDEKTIAYCTEEFPDVRWKDEVRNFILTSRRDGTRYLRHQEAFRKWILNADKFARRDAANVSVRVKGGNGRNPVADNPEVRSIVQRNQERSAAHGT